MFRNVVNSSLDSGASEESAFKQAWGALKNQGWKKGKDGGKWVKMAKTFKISKLDEDRNLVFGWANVSIRKDGDQIIDLQGDLIDPEDLEEAAYVFNLEFRKSGVMHDGDAVGELIESLIVTPDKLEAMGLEKDSLPLGWWVGFYIDDDEIFAKVKDGTYSMFSIQGKAVREEAA